jgi:hypothetical protein
MLHDIVERLYRLHICAVMSLELVTLCVLDAEGVHSFRNMQSADLVEPHDRVYPHLYEHHTTHLAPGQDCFANEIGVTHDPDHFRGCEHLRVGHSRVPLQKRGF